MAATPDRERLSAEQPAEHGAVATFGRMDRARRAMDALQRAGVEATLIHLRGPEAERAAGQVDTTERDVRETSRIGSRAAMGGAIGSAIGVVIGGVIGALVFEPFAGGFWGALLAGAIGGGAVGGVAAGVGSADLVEDVELTYDRDDVGPVRVEVFSPDPDVAARAAEVLERADGVHRVDRAQG
jgi:hypothetical protein